MKKLIALFTFIFSLAGCNFTANSSETSKDNLKISIASVAISGVLEKMNQPIVGRPETNLELPQIYQDIPEIGTSFSPNYEKILEVGTNLLIADEVFKTKIEEAAKGYGIETFFINTSTYESFIETIEKLGNRIDKEKEANEIVEEIKKPLKSFENLGKVNYKVALIFGTSSSSMLATKDTYVGSLANLFGVENIADTIISKNESNTPLETSGYINLNLEQLLKYEPDVILRFGHGSIEESKKSFEEMFEKSPVWSNLEAVKNNKVFDLDYNIFGTSANMRISEALEILGGILYEK